jgi:diguanylate cyclase (GGDEF)-like protein
MSKRAWFFYIWGVLLGGAALFAYSVGRFQAAETDWVLFILLLALSMGATLFKTETPGHPPYHPGLIFTFASVLILPFFPFILIVTASHLVDWVKEWRGKGGRLQAWYLQAFNIAMHTILGYIALSAFLAIRELPGLDPGLRIVLAGAAAALVYVSLNHFMIGLALKVARGISWRESGVFCLESLLFDLVMLLMGFAVATLLQQNLWMLIPALSPMYMIFRALSVPSLKLQASTDPKTGLWNDKYFRKVLDEEMSRSRRSGRPLTVVLADLDLLRNINNTFGHLAGDRVLIGVAGILKESVRDYDTVARFGGEEFAILMPEVRPDEAFSRIEVIRKRVERASFEAPTSLRPIKATMSFGIAGQKGKGQQSPDMLIHSADLSVYEAKLRGRNQTCLYSDQLALRLEGACPPPQIGIELNVSRSAKVKTGNLL